MDFTKYNQVPTEPATAAQIGLAAATLSALARRGLVEVIPGKPNKYRRIDNPAIKIYQLLEDNKDDYGEFFILQRSHGDYNGKMMCYLKGGEVVDCWGERYDLKDVVKVYFRTRSFDV